MSLFIAGGGNQPQTITTTKKPQPLNSWDPGICSSTELMRCPGENPKADFSPAPGTGVHKPPVKQQGKSFSEQEERTELMPSAPWQTSCQQAGSLGRCYSLKAKLDICGAHLQLLVISLACVGLTPAPMGVPVLHLALSPQRAVHGASVKPHQPLVLPPASLSRAGVCPCGAFAALQGEMPETLALTESLGHFPGCDA